MTKIVSTATSNGNGILGKDDGDVRAAAATAAVDVQVQVPLFKVRTITAFITLQASDFEPVGYHNNSPYNDNNSEHTTRTTVTTKVELKIKHTVSALEKIREQLTSTASSSSSSASSSLSGSGEQQGNKKIQEQPIGGRFLKRREKDSTTTQHQYAQQQQQKSNSKQDDQRDYWVIVSTEVAIEKILRALRKAKRKGPPYPSSTQQEQGENTNRMIFSVSQFKDRIPEMTISDVRSVETIYVDNEGNQQPPTWRPVEELFSNDEMEVEDEFNLFHVTSYENAHGISTDAMYVNHFDNHGTAEHPPTEDLNGINVDGFIHPVKVVDKYMHNVWLVKGGAIPWSTDHHIEVQGVPPSGKFIVYRITPEYRRLHHITQFSIPGDPNGWTQIVSPFTAPSGVSLPIKGLSQFTLDMNDYPLFIARQEVRDNIPCIMERKEYARIYHEIKQKPSEQYSDREKLAVFRYTRDLQRQRRINVENRRNEATCCCEDGCNEPAVTSYGKHHYCDLHRSRCIEPNCNKVISSDSKNKCKSCLRSSMECREIGCDKKVHINSKMCHKHSKICCVDECDNVVCGLFNGMPLFCKYHKHLAAIREKWKTLTCTNKDCTRKIRTVATGKCGPCIKGQSKY
mmetsp:Transcript_2455/g.2733  ORF Transcript_2455/g.2733 Transcript_2455/m.2733 type:complete len:626 (+) Transcript_2455:88-1965(+)